MRGKDIHVLRYYSSLVCVSEGRVISVSSPRIGRCPLASRFYAELRDNEPDQGELKQAIGAIIERKIKEHGFFTPRRRFNISKIQVPYGASEMLMSALRHGVIDAAVLVCDGAGTLISNSPDIVQAIGARMHTIIMTSPIPETMHRLKSLGCRPVSSRAVIDQFLGIRRAAQMGYKRIAVTIDGRCAAELGKLKEIEHDFGVKVISLIVCTTGMRQETAEKISRYADLVWSCASEEVRRKTGALAKIQLSELMPVFVMTQAGIDFAAGYCAEPAAFISHIDSKRSYLISARKWGKRIRLGNFTAFCEETRLPVLPAPLPLITDRNRR